MRASRRADLLIVLAVLMTAVAFGGYALIMLRWIAPAAPAAPSRPAPDAALTAARREYRAHLLDPAAHLRLSEALWKSGRLVDSFYVAQAARELFGDEEFLQAHAAVVLGAGGPAAAARKRLAGVTDPLQTIPILAEIARDHPRVPEGADCLDELARLAALDETGAAGEAARLARQALEELHADDPKDSAKLWALGRALLDKGELAAAEATAAEALSKDSKQPGAARIMGALALRRGDLDGGRRWLAQALAGDPDDAFSAGKIAQLYDRKRGDPEAALSYYIAVVRRQPDAVEDGAPAAKRVRELLDARRRSLLRDAPVDSLGPRFTADDASVRAEACARAAAFKDPRWALPIAELLDDDVELVRRDADFALYQIGKKSPEALRPLRDELLGSERPLVRIRALNLFADLDGQDVLPAALAALKDRDPAVRVFAKVMLFDRYYKDVPETFKTVEAYAAGEQDPAAKALLLRLGRP